MKEHPMQISDLEARLGVIAYFALTGGHGNDSGSPLWNLAEEAGWTLEDFVREVDVLSYAASEHEDDAPLEPDEKPLTREEAEALTIQFRALTPQGPTTFAQAREIVRASLALGWPAEYGVLYVDPEGHENSTTWHVCAGPESWWDDEDPNPAATICGWPAFFVDKASGVFTQAAMVGSLDLIASMRPCTSE
jgi:hypothetical protein